MSYKNGPLCISIKQNDLRTVERQKTADRMELKKKRSVFVLRSHLKKHSVPKYIFYSVARFMIVQSSFWGKSNKSNLMRRKMAVS